MGLGREGEWGGVRGVGRRGRRVRGGWDWEERESVEESERGVGKKGGWDWEERESVEESEGEE
jgi:hypothetical protein